MAEIQKIEDNDLIPAEIRSELSLRNRGGGDVRPEPEKAAEPEQAAEPSIPQEKLSNGIDEQKPDLESGTMSAESANLEVGDAAFAESVMFGLEQAGLEQAVSEDPLPRTDEPPFADETVSQAEAAPLNDAEAQGHEAYFADWGSAEEIDPIEDSSLDADISLAPGLREETFTHEHTLAELSLASALEVAPAENEFSDPDLSSKHDALADAVQSALLSIYGDANTQESEGDEWSVQSEEEAWNANTQAAASEFDDGLSPQDVILNYFSYDPEKAEQAPARPGVFHGQDSSSDGVLGQRFEQRSTQQFAPIQQTPQPESATHYSGPAAFPVPARPIPQPQADTNKRTGGRDSGRLLGAAAIGLIGGIAIAATLAVFVISSYPPSDRGNTEGKSGQALRSAAGDPGYGSTSENLVPTATRPAETPNDLVASDVVVPEGQPAVLSIKLNSTRPSDQTLVSISGVPQGARLNAGIDAGGGNWLLPPRRLNGLILNLPADAPSSIPLGVQLLDSNVRTPLSEKRMFTVQLTGREGAPALARSEERTETVVASVASISTSAFNTQTLSAGFAAAPSAAASGTPQPEQFRTQTVPAQTTSPVSSAPVASVATRPALQTPSLPATTSLVVPPKGVIQQAEIEDLIREGNKRMREGDIVEARQFYLKAVNLGDAEAALAMGRSFDPIYFARIDKKNAEPDVAKAFDWYRKAMDSGATQTARIRIENLQHFLNE